MIFNLSKQKLCFVKTRPAKMFTSAAVIKTIRIVSLPRELKNELDVTAWVTTLLHADKLSVTIAPMTTTTGVGYRTAFVEIGEWDCEQMHEHDQLLAAGSAGVMYSDYTNVFSDRVPMNFHFENGKPMSHIKMMAITYDSQVPTPDEPVVVQALSKEPLDLDSGAWTDLYIPMIPADLSMDNGDMNYNTEDHLAEFFEDQLMLGKVNRIEFVSKDYPGSSKTVRTAIVKFEHWYDNNTATSMRDAINTNEQFVCNGYYDGYEFCPFMYRRFISLKRHFVPEPVATSEKDVYEKRIAELEAEIAKLKSYTTVRVLE